MALRYAAQLWKPAALVLCHLVFGYIGFRFYLDNRFVPLGWPAIGVEVVLVTWWGLRYWPALVVGSAVYQFLILGMTGFSGALFVAGEVGEVMFGAFLLGRGIDWSRGFFSLRQMRRGLKVGVVAPLVGAFFGTLGIAIDPQRSLPFPMLASVFGSWWLRSAVGFLFVAPAIGSWRNRPKEPLGSQPKEGAALVLFVVAISLVAFTDWLPIAAPPVWFGMLAGLPLLWAGARLGVRFTTQLSLLVLATASLASLNRVAIFAHLEDGTLRLLWWTLLNVCALCGTVLAVLTQRSLRHARGIVAARNRLELLVHNSPMAMVEWDLDFRVRAWSRKAEEIFGFSQEQALGSHVLDLLVPEADHAKVKSQWQRVLAGEEGVCGTNSNRTADGREILCDWFGSPVFDERGRVVGVVCMVEDVTDREHTAAALRRSQSRFDAVTEVIPQAISYYSPQLEVLYGNQAYLDSRRLRREDFPIPLSDLMDEEVRTSSQPHIVEVLLGRTVRFLETITMADGERHDLDRVLLPDVGPEGEVHGFFSVCTDITQYRQAARERLALEVQVLQTQKLESLGLLSGRIAHEFNNRLCGILGHSDMARSDLKDSPERAAASMDKAMEIAREASELCRQLYVYSGHGSGVKTVQGVNPLLQEMRRLLELTLPRNVRLRTQLEDQLPEVQVDAAQLRQAILNLVQNAAQAVGEERGEVRLCSRAVRLRDCEPRESFLRGEDPEQVLVEICVEDDGEGMSEEVLARSFEPFFTRRAGARGLGLSGVLGIVHGHSGAIGLASTPGEGAAIRLWFPVKHAFSAEVRAPRKEDPQHA